MTSEPPASSSAEGHPSRLALELWAFTPEGGPRDASVSEHLARCSTCAHTVSTWRQARATFLTQRPARSFLDSITAAAPRELSGPRPTRPALRWGLGLALAASLLALIGRGVDDRGVDDAVHLKGAAGLALEVLASRDGAPATPAPPGTVFGPGDVLRFAVSVPQDGYVFIADVDATGHFTRYFPQSGTASGRLGRATRLVLPGSIALDDYVGEERVVLIFSPVPLEEARVEKALRVAYQRAGLDGLEHAELPALSASVLVKKGLR